MAPDALDTEALVDLFARMELIRAFEERAGVAYGLRKIGGFCHLYSGQEAVAVGAVSVIDLSRDYLFTGYRDHGHALACGMDPKAVMAELYGKVTGASRGKGGSMHLFAPERGMFGGNGIVGAQIPIATGAALAQAYRKSGGVTLCFFGDGAFHQGALHESLNLASVWSLPIVYVVENNQWGMGTNWRRVSAEDDFAATAAAYGMQGEACDGMDLFEVRAAVGRAVARARDERKPGLVEARTYRYKGHSMSDPQKYRAREEIDEYRKRDPIARLGEKLKKDGGVSEERLSQITAEAERRVEEAVAFAEESPEPSRIVLYEDVLAPNGAAGRGGSGR